MRKLLDEEIEKLASRTGVKRIAAENFLSSMGLDYFDACGNLALDAKLYKWNAQTKKAISDGIELAMKEPTVVKEK